MPASLDHLEQELDYRFQNRDLLLQALTHSSTANETQALPAPVSSRNNERLEFLGDSILGMMVSEWLFRRFPDYSEGQLSLVKNYLVSATHLLHTSHRLNLGQYLHLGRGEESAGGRSKQRLLVNAVEAIIAAIYLDSGVDGAYAVRSFIDRFLMPNDEDLAQLAGAGPPQDYRAELDRLARDRNLGNPVYTIVSESGPGHARIFTVEVRLAKGLAGSGQGSSKKAASHDAARHVCRMVRGETPAAPSELSDTSPVKIRV